MEDNQEIGAYMFRRTVPAVHMAPEDVRWMVSSALNIMFCARIDPSDHMPTVKVIKYGNQMGCTNTPE